MDYGKVIADAAGWGRRRSGRRKHTLGVGSRRALAGRRLASSGPARRSHAVTAAAPNDLLVVNQVDVLYGAVHALHAVSLVVRAGELVCLLDGNATGKSTTMKTVLGLAGLVSRGLGTITFAGQRIHGLKTSQIVRGGSLGAGGVAHLPRNDRTRESC